MSSLLELGVTSIFSGKRAGKRRKSEETVMGCVCVMEKALLRHN